MADQELLKSIQSNTAIIGIIGMGYVGLPLALTFADNGFMVVGFDVDPDKAESLNAGVSYISHIPSEKILGHNKSGRLSVTTEFAVLRDVDAIIICVPTPLTRARKPDLSYVY